MNNKQKIIIIISVAVAILLVGLIVKKSQESANLLQEAGDTAQQITEKATQGVLPSITANPMENKPDLNPVDKANPIKNIKINPFD